MGPVSTRIYEEHGAAVARYGITAGHLSRVAACDWDTAKRVVDYVAEHGAPPEGTEPKVTAAPPCTHVVVPDAHVHPSQDLRRFRWLAGLIRDECAAHAGIVRLISVGDWGDYSSLCSYTKGQASSWGKTYPADVAAHRESVKVLREACGPAIWERLDKHWTEGNHEERAGRYMERNPELQGHLLEPLEVMAEAGFTCHTFLEWVVLDGVGYCHYMQTPSSRYPVSSAANKGRALILKGLRPVVVGHSHQHAISQPTARAWGNPIQTVDAGCFFEHEERYAKQSNQGWWRGVVVLHNVSDGAFDPTPIRMESLRARYG